MTTQRSLISEYERALLALRARWQEAVKQTMTYDAKWNRVNDEINAKLDAEGCTDIVQRNHRKSDSLALRDALAAGNWWRSKADHLANTIQTEIMLQAELTRIRKARAAS